MNPNVSKRNQDGTFLKGSGNPGGTPKALRRVRDLCREMTPEACRKLGELMRQDTDQAVALNATKEILARAIGKHIDPELLWRKTKRFDEEGSFHVKPKDLTDDQLNRILAVMREGIT